MASYQYIYVMKGLSKRRRSHDAVGQPLPTLVEGDDAREAGQLAEKLAVLRELVVELDMREYAGDHDDVDGTIARDLIGDAEAIAFGILSVRQLHVSTPYAEILIPARSNQKPPRCQRRSKSAPLRCGLSLLLMQWTAPTTPASRTFGVG